MRMLTSPAPSRTATVSRCPQCGAIMRIKIIEPDLRDPSKARHVFECEECSLPRTYFIEAA
jgi:RNase P subunit RPR2